MVICVFSLVFPMFFLGSAGEAILGKFEAFSLVKQKNQGREGQGRGEWLFGLSSLGLVVGRGWALHLFNSGWGFHPLKAPKHLPELHKLGWGDVPLPFSNRIILAVCNNLLE